jgi:hypothetical protein
MDTTVGINLGAKPEYKGISNELKSFLIEVCKQIHHQTAFEERMILAKEIDRYMQAKSRSLDHFDEAEAALAAEPPKVKESFHSIKEIKAVIAANIQPIYEYFKDRVFSLSAFTDHLKSYVTLREHDYNPNSSYHRWETQVNSSIRRVKLKGYVIEPTGRRGYYTINPTQPTQPTQPTPSPSAIPTTPTPTP